MKRLILIRHGETDYTVKGRYCGHRGIPLNGQGIKEVNALRQKIKGIEIDRIYSSDLRRALQSAKIIFKERRIIKERGLREIDFGRFCGLTFKESSKLYPDAYKIWIASPEDLKIPGGETFQRFAKRVTACFKKISIRNKKETVAIVSHGGPIRIILLNLLKLGFDKFWNIEQETAALNVIDFINGVPKPLKINDITV